MAGKPKAGFWIVMVLIITGLVAFSLFRAGILSRGGSQDSNGKDLTITPPKGGTIEITMYSSSAKKKWINEMVNKFNSSGKTLGNKNIVVKQFHVTSGGSFDELKTGKIRPDIWSPGDESWLQLAATHWKNVKQKTLFENYKPLVNIPLIVAMWEPMARVLGYPNPIGWKDIAAVAANPEGWKAYGHPEWAKFRWGHAHPDANSGFLTIISEVYAATGKTEGITPEDLKKPEVVSFLKEFEGTVEHYGLSNSWIDDLMHKKGPGYLSATVQYENTIIQTNEKHQNKPFKLVAIYPKEGNFWTQHPAAVLKEEWMTREKEEACNIFINYLLSKDAQQIAMQMGLRPFHEDIELSAPFDPEHGVQLDISKAQKFMVPGEDVLKRIRDLWEDVKVPATVVLVMDRSGSMKGEPMDNAKIGGVEFVKNMKHRDKLKITVFNNQVYDLTGFCNIQECGEDSIAKLQGLFADGGTALYDATAKAYNDLMALKKNEPGRRYSILVLSDGRDTSSKTKRHDFLDSLPEGEDFDVPKIYTIAYGNEADKDLLAEISNRTNARIFESSPEEIARTYKELSANF